MDKNGGARPYRGLNTSMIKIVKAPVRIDFGGGTTDIYPFTKKGGAVLNAAINRYITGILVATNQKVSLEYHAQIPTSSGLGTSGAMNVVWLSLISDIEKKRTLAEKVYQLEQAIGIVGGKQDEYAAALGGINFLEFKDEKTHITQIHLSKAVIRQLESKLVLCYTKKPHLATDVNNKVIERVLQGNTKTIATLKKISHVAHEMKNALHANDLNHFGELFNEEWSYRKQLHPRITTPKLEATIKKGLNNGANGAKVCGAAGGGSILFYCDNKKKVIEAVKKSNHIIDFKFDFRGIRVIKHKT